MVAVAVRETDPVEGALGGREKLQRLVRGYSRNVSAYSAHLPQLLKEHRGDWVAFSGGKLVTTTKTRKELRRFLKSEGGYAASLIIRRVEEPGKVRFH